MSGNEVLAVLWAALGLILSVYGTLLALRKGIKLATFLDDNMPNPLEFITSSITLVLLTSIANLLQAASKIV